MISAIAEKWTNMFPKKMRVNIEKKPEGVFVNGQKADKIMFNHIQLRFVMPNGVKYILFDSRSQSDLSIKEMYNQLS